MPLPLRHGGETLFLASTEVLQQVLLPRLAAADLLRLSLCCKEMHSWLLSTPPDLWQVLVYQEQALPLHRLRLGPQLISLHLQDAPKGAAATFLAVLTSTAEILAAVRRAYTARHNILTQAPAVRVETVRLPDQTGVGPQEQRRMEYLSCRQISFSSCGRWLAVVMLGVQRPYTTQPGHGASDVRMFEVVLYASEALEQQARICTYDSETSIQWAQAAPHLCVATLPGYRFLTQLSGPCRQEFSALPNVFAAFVVDAQTGSQIHALSAEVAQ